MLRTIEHLEKLIAFPTVSRDPNRELIDYCEMHLSELGFDCVRLPNSEGTKANLYASIGPVKTAGVMLSGHTDVVPVDGQDWSVPAFALTERDGRLYGRGTADMKGYVAAMLSVAEAAATRTLATPLHLAFSYDEEIGCIGVRSLVEMLESAPIRPRFCIVGEPTGMAVATGHKGKTAFRARCRGVEAHSALAPTGLNAIHLASDFITAIRALQAEIEASGRRDGDYDIPYTTVHVGTVSGGVALNIVPSQAELGFEIRNLTEDDPARLLARLDAEADTIVSSARQNHPMAAIEIETLWGYPGLDTPPEAEVVAFVKGLLGANRTIKVAFGTEGGLFDQRLNVPTVVCGPGSMAQGHKPDEFVERDQLVRCDAMLAALLDRLEAGI